MVRFQRAVFLSALLVAVTPRGFSQASNSASKPDSDVLVSVDGEKLIGRLERATGSSVVFKSDVAGEVTVEWSKIREARSFRSSPQSPKR